MMVETRIQGARELDQVLRRLPGRLGVRALTSAVRSGSVVIRNEAKARAPVDSGELRDNIITKKARGGGASVTFQVGPSKRAFHGLFVEFGTRFAPARPFLRPAFETKKVEALAKIGKDLGKKVEKAAVALAGPLSKSGLVKRRRRR